MNFLGSLNAIFLWKRYQCLGPHKCVRLDARLRGHDTSRLCYNESDLHSRSYKHNSVMPAQAGIQTVQIS
jgi:hypothetical protein